ncbi:MAG TPA: DUF4446 family protein [Candidatus Baltobacteraceae bacterium]|nr:DUF4446 family protein [Candidatus Baltobacteraceae bacterium]
MQTDVIAAIAAFAAALIALAVYHVAVIKPALSRHAVTLAAHDELLGGGAAAATGRLASLEAQGASLKAQAERAAERLRELDAASRTDLSRTGFVRFDAFENTGSELSYALALLNRDGDGVVLSSIYSREDVRTFGKAVQGWKPSANASAEELSAIAQARDSAS